MLVFRIMLRTYHVNDPCPINNSNLSLERERDASAFEKNLLYPLCLLGLLAVTVSILVTFCNKNMLSFKRILGRCIKYRNFTKSLGVEIMRKRTVSAVSGESHETLHKFCVSTKFPHQQIRWNFGFLQWQNNAFLVILSFKILQSYQGRI